MARCVGTIAACYLIQDLSMTFSATSLSLTPQPINVNDLFTWVLHYIQVTKQVHDIMLILHRNKTTTNKQHIKTKSRNRE